jgi:glycosyltransferase involved in cell wall biosynthesis
MHNFACGGAEHMMLNIAAEMIRVGHRVDIAVVDGRGELAALVPKHVNIFDLGCRRTSYAISKLVHYLNSERPDVVLSGLVHINTAAVLAKFLAVHEFRLVISERNTSSKEVRSCRTFLVRAAYAATAWSYPWADSIIAVSKGVADDLARYARLPRSAIEVVNNPVVTPQILMMSEEEPDVPWPDAERGPVILGVGRLAPQKDFVTLLHAFARVLGERQCSLVILGEGPERLILEREVLKLGLRDNVTLPGYTRNPYSAMRRARLFVLCSTYEGSPNALVEAMALGTPVIATDCPNGPREILLGGVLAPLVPVGDVQALATAILAALASSPNPEQLVRRASDYGVEESFRQYVEVLFGE